MTWCAARKHKLLLDLTKIICPHATLSSDVVAFEMISLLLWASYLFRRAFTATSSAKSVRFIVFQCFLLDVFSHKSNKLTPSFHFPLKTQ